MADIHIDDFYQDCARILLKLYSYFPRKGDIYVDEIIGEFELDEFGIPSARHLACFSSMLWLADEQYLRYHDQSRQDGLGQAVLAERAFLALTSPVDLPLEPLDDLPATVATQQGTLAHQLRTALNQQDALLVRRLLLELFHRKRPGS
ncbi:hypothetical protein [Aestuariirhabdus litorea]|uniref:Uncharacterized protein n=1 Tax=Aestuariirhabdus litorea TaxID=2528527 RepID=A0A3P3VNX9_9GAMM|nr:hypothetical protein [Aestuariirhabdus litorea]RRJ84471.1 hypothetical protein D0544_05025 [Aestuariirhabdus litorea]RWW97695.1 hypothetical protein DZC74_05015 [Endozoicomonadaceae bacterium GTF-13]